MKTLICAAMVAASMLTMAAEATTSATPAANAAKAAKTVETAKKAPRRAQLTDEQRAQMRAKREQFIAQHKAAMEAKVLEVVKKYVPDEEKAKALVAELQEVLKTGRRGMMRGAKPAGAPVPAADAK